jgi:hypothetical protein
MMGLVEVVGEAEMCPTIVYDRPLSLMLHAWQAKIAGDFSSAT